MKETLDPSKWYNIIKFTAGNRLRNNPPKIVNNYYVISTPAVLRCYALSTGLYEQLSPETDLGTNYTITLDSNNYTYAGSLPDTVSNLHQFGKQ